jgi:hypothetical protein
MGVAFLESLSHYYVNSSSYSILITLMKIALCWYVTPCVLVYGYLHWWEAWCFHLQGHLPWIWGQEVSPQVWKPNCWSHCVTFHMTAPFIASAMKTSDPTVWDWNIHAFVLKGNVITVIGVKFRGLTVVLQILVWKWFCYSVCLPHSMECNCVILTVETLPSAFGQGSPEFYGTQSFVVTLVEIHLWTHFRAPCEA